jgi:PleD family two-component response regulator
MSENSKLKVRKTSLRAAARGRPAAPVATPYPAEILIVEDDAEDGEVIMGTLAYNLSRNGFGVSRATNGADALRTARNSGPDLILLDIHVFRPSGDAPGVASFGTGSNR